MVESSSFSLFNYSHRACSYMGHVSVRVIKLFVIVVFSLLFAFLTVSPAFANADSSTDETSAVNVARTTGMHVSGGPVEQFVTRLYSIVLDRTPDAKGLRDHVAALQAGTPAAEIAWGFFGSPEFTNKELINGERVDIAYRTMLDRSADSAGKADWTSKLDAGMSMRFIISGFAGSPEFRSLCARWGLNPGSLDVVENRDWNYSATAFVSRLYKNVLNRSGDVGGLNTHTGSLHAGGHAAQLAWSFFGSPEFSQRPITNDDRVEIAYKTMLNRPSDGAGKKDWAGKLNAGMPIYLLIAGFSESAEFQKLCQGYGITAGRLPYDPAEMAKYSSSQGGGNQPAPQPEKLSMTIEYAQPVKCGTPTTFIFKATGGNGNYKYMPYSLMIKNGDSWEQVIDLTYQSYTTKNTFEYAFVMSGEYRFTVALIDPPDNYGLTRFTTEFTISADQGPTFAQRVAAADAKANEAWEQCKAAGCTTDYEKALWLHDWIINNCEYDHDLLYFKDVDLFANGLGTCEAYHAAYMKLLDKAGIKCGRVYDAGHVWTLVRIDGLWYHIDTTHDDTGDKNWFGLGDDERHLYFGLTDQLLNDVLAIDGGEIKGKSINEEASSFASNYFIKSGRIKHYSATFLQDIQANLDAGKTSFELAVPQRLDGAISNLPSKYKMILYTLVAYDLENSTWTANGASVSLEVSYDDGMLNITAT